jgi:GT2 family glycosyltransferase
VPGLASARNAGVKGSTGELVAFTDDDCYVAPELLTTTVAAFEDPVVGFVSGRILLHDPTDYPATINESLAPAVFQPGRYVRPGALQGANMAFRRSVLEQIGGFDPLFGSGSLFPAEDCDAAARASLKGWTGKYVPEIVVSHHHGRKAGDIPKLLRDYDVGRGAYHMKLLVKLGALRPGLKGWAGLPRRMRERPSTARGEFAGAWRYLWARWGPGRPRAPTGA